jgi:ligand-binding SRPBCC domain-containing protein
MMHRLTTRQWLPITLEEAWEFFSIPENLNRLTPEGMSFQILSGGGEKTFAGHVICYKVRPLFNIPMRWVTEIVNSEEGQYFIDEQRFGPYRFWHHLHRFTPGDGGVWMDDVLHYVLPAGWVGEAMGALFLHGKVDGIFTYRGMNLKALFPGASDAIQKREKV